LCPFIFWGNPEHRRDQLGKSFVIVLSVRRQDLWFIIKKTEMTNINV
jgi:hypothetical protein